MDSDSSMKVSILDQSPISEGFTGADALRNTLDLARLADTLGYARYWVAEHHGTPMLACASPEVMIAAIGSMTSRLRIGSGGVMLPHYSPLKVAETFSILSALFPDRVDLGIGRAPGTDHATAYALQRDRRQPAPDDFPERLENYSGIWKTICLPAIRSPAWQPCLDGLMSLMSGCLAPPRKAQFGLRTMASPTVSPIS
jgi:luciferase family oxidoreductase group 1